MNGRIHRLSKIFQPLVTTPKNAKLTKTQELVSKSQKLLMEYGLVRATSNGCHIMLPLAQRSINKLTAIIRTELDNVGAQEVTMSCLTDAELWAKSGRLDEMKEELFQTTDRHGKKYILSPTHEEAVTDVFSSISPLTYRSLPIILYQITDKFRDERRSRGALLRARNFSMCDAYSVHADMTCALDTYELVCQAYHAIFDRIGVNYFKVSADNGCMGGSMSHEWHYISEAGEDTLFHCDRCNLHTLDAVCGHCGDKLVDNTIRGIEVAHTFVLGDTYSGRLNASVARVDGTRAPLHMCCYGVGVTRLLAATLEVLATDDRLVWPESIAPYTACIIGAKDGSKELNASEAAIDVLYKALDQHAKSLANDMLYDDRSGMTIGKRVFEATRMGYPTVIVCAKSALDGKYELINTRTGVQTLCSVSELLHILSRSTSDTSVHGVASV